MSEGFLYEIEWLGGNCPVQAKGTVDGKKFYFRARGQHWSLEIGVDPPWSDDNGWYYAEEYPGGEYAAGWMKEEEALCFIEKGMRLYAEDLEKDKSVT